MFEGNQLLELADRLSASFITRGERLYAGSWWAVPGKTADYTLTLADVAVGVNTAAGNITITLPTLASSAGKLYNVKKTSADANTVTIDGDGSETIDGATTRTLSAQNDALTIISNGVNNWRVIASYGGGGGPLSSAYVAKTANYTLTNADGTVNCTSGTFTLTLPTAVGATGRVYNLKNSGNGVITIATTSSQTIDGNASGVLTLVQYDNLTVQSTGAGWIIL